jgi:diaminopimelate epimerase
MNPVEFSKFHGFGNDYIVIERGKIADGIEVSSLAREMCNRHTGVGGDGLAIIEESKAPEADFSCEIVNPDGSIAGFSGNGTRCAVAYLYHTARWRDETLRLKTPSGVKNYRLLGHSGDSYEFDAEIGEPAFSSDRIPVLLKNRADAVLNEQIEINGSTHGFSAVNVGNPVACIFVETFDFDWRSVGRAMEKHPAFPERVNVVFVKVLDTENIELRIWERGAGETAASGTCSAGAAILSAFLLKTRRSMSVHSPGGTTRVVWRDDDQIVLTGKAELAFFGVWRNPS